MIGRIACLCISLAARPVSRPASGPGSMIVLTLLVFAALLIASGVGNASAQRVLSVTAHPTAILARGGESTVTVRIPASAAGAETRVQLSTELGAFTGSSGPTEITTPLHDVGNDIRGASVSLFADGRAGTSVVTARVGSLVDTVTIRFVGEPSELRLVQPSAGANLDASRQHPIRIVAMDSAGVKVPSAELTLELLDPLPDARLRSGATSSSTVLTVTANANGEAGATLTSAPGNVRILASSGSARLTIEFRLYGAPTTLRIVSVDEAAVERGTIGEAGSLQVLLLDERRQGVPNKRIRFLPAGGLVVSAEGDGESFVTDGSGRSRAHLDASNARLGTHTLTATWTDDDETLSDELSVRVTGSPVAMYLRARQALSDVGEPLIDEFATVTRFVVEAEVVDEIGQPVAGTHQVRWRPLVSGAGAHVHPVVSTTRDGIASATFSLEHTDTVPQIDSTWAQAWLIAKAQVNNRGLISDLLGEGVPLRASWNNLVWLGPEMPVSMIVESIQHVVSAAWRQGENGGWQAWFTANVPGAVDFTLQTGDSFHLVLQSAALLPNVKRR